MLHELRIYHCMPGKLAALHQRFVSATLKLWEKHEIQPVGFWTFAIGPSTAQLYYLLEWKDLAEREQRWNAFVKDPEWVSKRAESEKDGALVTHMENYILQPTDYSPLR